MFLLGAGPARPEGRRWATASTSICRSRSAACGRSSAPTRAGPRVPGAPVRGGAGQTEAVVQGERRVSVPRSSATGRGTAPWKSVAAGISPRRTSPGPCGEVHRQVSRDRGRPPAREADVKITGEFYLQTVEGDPNYNIHRWLEAEGARGLSGRRSPSGWTTCCAWACSVSRTTAASSAARGSSSARGRAAQARLPVDVQPPAPRHGRPPARASRPVRAAPARRARTSTAASTAARATCWSARRCGPISKEGAHDLRAVALLLHAEHHERRRHGRRDRQVSRISSTRRSRSRATPRSTRSRAAR